MAYNELLADRIRQSLREKSLHDKEIKMMGGLCFMVDDKMCAGIVKNDLMARIDPGFHKKALTMKGCREMDFTKRPMKGFVFVSPEGTDLDEDLDTWIELCLDYNPKVKTDKKQKSSE